MKKVIGLMVTVLVLSVFGAGVAIAQTLLVSTSSNTIRKFALSGQDLGIFASGLNDPDGLAFDRAGNLYVDNVRGSTIREFSPTGQDLGIFASTGVNEPLFLAFDSQGNLFVSNDADNSIHKLSPSGEDLGVFVSLLGAGCPGGLAFSLSGNLLVADLCRSVIREYSPTGENLGIFASAGLSNPGDLAIDATGNLFVSNTDNGGEFRNTIHKFSPTGQDLGIFASTGLHFPGGLAFDPLGNLFVANGEQRPGGSDYSIRKFSPTGEDLGDFAVLSDQPRDLAVAPTCATPPLIMFSVTPTSLWPPNGKMVPVTVSGKITDTGCTVTTAAYTVTDEYGRVQPSGPVTVGAGGAYSFTVLLQASRLGTDLNGRLYTVTVGSTNNAGKIGSKVATVTVPHAQRH
jgi:sugar lactone lactonase YvrE